MERQCLGLTNRMRVRALYLTTHDEAVVQYTTRTQENHQTTTQLYKTDCIGVDELHSSFQVTSINIQGRQGYTEISLIQPEDQRSRK